MPDTNKTKKRKRNTSITNAPNAPSAKRFHTIQLNNTYALGNFSNVATYGPGGSGFQTKRNRALARVATTNKPPPFSGSYSRNRLRNIATLATLSKNKVYEPSGPISNSKIRQNMMKEGAKIIVKSKPYTFFTLGNINK